jgi:hypothetical protein
MTWLRRSGHKGLTGRSGKSNQTNRPGLAGDHYVRGCTPHRHPGVASSSTCLRHAGGGRPHRRALPGPYRRWWGTGLEDQAVEALVSTGCGARPDIWVPGSGRVHHRPAGSSPSARLASRASRSQICSQLAEPRRAGASNPGNSSSELAGAGSARRRMPGEWGFLGDASVDMVRGRICVGNHQRERWRLELVVSATAIERIHYRRRGDLPLHLRWHEAGPLRVGVTA